MATLSPDPRGRPTPHPGRKLQAGGPGAAHLLARRKRAARGGRVPSPGCLAGGERPAANPGGAPGRRARAAGTLGRSPPAPAPNPPQGEQQHRGAGWTRTIRLHSFGSRRRRGRCFLLLSARLRSASADPPADSSAARCAGSLRPCSRHAGGRDRGTRVRRGGGTRGGDARARSRWRELRLRPSPARVQWWHCQPCRSLAT